jgi:DNA-binding GntR family transcriptional regulator
VSQQELFLPDGLFMDLDRSGPVPLYFQVSTRLEDAISKGDLPPGSRLENEISLSARLGLSRPTVRRAIQELVDKGLLVRRRGIGTQVVHAHVTRRVELTSLYEDLVSGNRRPSTRLLLYTVIEVDAHIGQALSIPVGDPALHVRRVRSADDVPVAVLDNYLPGDFADIPQEDLGKYGLYQILRSRGTTMSVARQLIGARRATPEESDLLEIDKGSPVLTMDRTAYDKSGRAVEFGHHCYRPDLYSFEITLVDK